MPVIFERLNLHGPAVARYEWPARYVTPTSETADALRQWRKDAVKDQELFLTRQKACGRADPAARFFKEESRHHLKLQRACTLMIPSFGEPDAVEKGGLWPCDLAPELDEISRRIVLEFG